MTPSFEFCAFFLHFKITVALFAPITWTDFICRPLTVRHEWSKKPDQGRYEGALLHPPCFLDRGRACCVHNCRSRFQRPPPPSEKKKNVRRREGKKWSQLYNTSARCCCSLLSSSPLHHYYYYSWWLTCAAAEHRILHPAHRLQSVGMSACGSDGAADPPAGRCMGPWGSELFYVSCVGLAVFIITNPSSRNLFGALEKVVYIYFPKVFLNSYGGFDGEISIFCYEALS